MALAKDEIVRNEILEKAQKLFQQFGLKKTTMDEIAEACGKAKSTLYHYFKSKEDVFDAVLNLELRDLRIIVKNKADGIASVKEKVIVYLITFHNEVVTRANLYRIVKHEIFNESVEQKYFKYLMEYETSYITRIMEDSFDVAEFQGVNKDDIRWFSETMLAGFFGIVRYSLESETGIDQEKLEASVNMLIPRLFV